MWEQAVKKHKEQQEKNDKKESLLDKLLGKDKDKKDKKKTELEKKQEELESMGEKDAFKKNLEDKKKQLEELKEAISKQASQACTSTNRDIRTVNNIGTAKPLIDWRYVLREAIKYDVDWSYKNATLEDGVVNANLEEQPMPETEIVLDTSGSINEVLLKNFLRECKNILQHTKLKVGCFDTEFYGFHEIRTEEDIENGIPWTTVISGLPVTYDYKIEEIVVDGNVYRSEVTSEGDSFTITNTLKWSAKKVSEQRDDGTVNNLKGAEFELKDGSTVIATGTSGEDGMIAWKVKSGQNIDLKKLNGEYTIIETKAPEGYMIHDSGWTLIFSKGLLKTFDGKPVKGNATDGVVISLTNKQLYELPETGGIGIFWYTIGGMLLMMAAALILYKRKCREVLDK